MCLTGSLSAVPLFSKVLLMNAIGVHWTSTFVWVWCARGLSFHPRLIVFEGTAAAHHPSPILSIRSRENGYGHNLICLKNHYNGLFSMYINYERKRNVRFVGLSFEDVFCIFSLSFHPKKKKTRMFATENLLHIQHCGVVHRFGLPNCHSVSLLVILFFFSVPLLPVLWRRPCSKCTCVTVCGQSWYL